MNEAIYIPGVLHYRVGSDFIATPTWNSKSTKETRILCVLGINTDPKQLKCTHPDHDRKITFILVVEEEISIIDAWMGNRFFRLQEIITVKICQKTPVL